MFLESGSMYRKSIHTRSIGPLLDKCDKGATLFGRVFLLHIWHMSGNILPHLQWGKKVFSQPPIVQVLPLKKMREACNFHHRYTSTMRDKIEKKSRKITCRIFKNFICKLWWKISIWSITKCNLNTLLYTLCWQ